MSKNSTEQDTELLKVKIEEMEKSLIKLEKLIDECKKQGEKDAVKTLEVFHSDTLQEIEKLRRN